MADVNPRQRDLVPISELPSASVTFPQDDRVAIRFVLHGMHTGAFFSVPPTRRTVTVAAHIILHVSGGQVTKLLGVFDEAGLMRQLAA